MTQNNLGLALRHVAELEGGITEIEAAVEAHLAALDVFQEAGTSYELENVRSNLAAAQRILAERRQ